MAGQSGRASAARRVEALRSSLQLTEDATLAAYLRVGEDELRRFLANPDLYSLPPVGEKALEVASRYVKASDLVLAVLPRGWAQWCRRWECKRARLLAQQRSRRT